MFDLCWRRAAAVQNWQVATGVLGGCVGDWRFGDW